jgi:integrase
MDAARRAAPEIETFCLTLAYTGARISEVLALVPLRIDFFGERNHH